MELGTLAAIARYPVKSLKGEALEEAAVVHTGLDGDRVRAMIVRDGHARTGKTYRGKEDNRLHLIDEPEAARNAAAGRGVDVEVHAGERYYDAGDVSIVLDCWIAEVEAALGKSLEPLRWRPNFYLRAQSKIAEADLTGMYVAVGDAVLHVLRPIHRCVTPTYDIVTGESDPAIQRFVAQERDNTMGVYCEVVRTGAVRKGEIASISRASGDLRPLAPA